MRNLTLFPVVMAFCFVSFSGHSGQLSRKRKADALFMMEALSKGDILAYHGLWASLGIKGKKKILKFVNEDGDNILHFLVRLERFEILGSPPSDYTTTPGNILLSEIHRIKDLDAWAYARLLTQKNKQGVSPAQEAATSLDWTLMESDDNWRSKLLADLSEQTVLKLLGHPVPPENRGLSYRSLKSAFEDYDWWYWRIPFEAVISGAVIFTGGAVIAVSLADPELISAPEVLGAGLLGACATSWLRLPRLRRAKRSLSAPLH